jgi:hypothetical protein
MIYGGGKNRCFPQEFNTHHFTGWAIQQRTLLLLVVIMMMRIENRRWLVGIPASYLGCSKLDLRPGGVQFVTGFLVSAHSPSKYRSSTPTLEQAMTISVRFWFIHSYPH